jgi:hypothetical protein
MPESGYTTKPNADTRTFAAQMLHLAKLIMHLPHLLQMQKVRLRWRQLKMQWPLEKNSNKAVLDSYAFVIAGLKPLTPSRLQEKFNLFGKFELTREMVFAKDFEHQPHLRAHTAPYLHLAGVTPPPEKLF